MPIINGYGGNFTCPKCQSDKAGWICNGCGELICSCEPCLTLLSPSISATGKGSPASGALRKYGRPDGNPMDENELEKAFLDSVLFGTGGVMFQPDGTIKHVPYEDLPKAGESERVEYD